jgi:hypothetical protein
MTNDPPQIWWKYFCISSYIRKPFLLYDFAPDPIWISYIWGKFSFFFNVVQSWIIRSREISHYVKRRRESLAAHGGVINSQILTQWEVVQRCLSWVIRSQKVSLTDWLTLCQSCCESVAAQRLAILSSEVSYFQSIEGSHCQPIRENHFLARRRSLWFIIS